MIKLLHPRLLAAPSACALVAASLSLALLPLAASANSGSITATEDCQTWSASVQLDNNVTPDHHVDVVVSNTFGHPGFLDRSFDTHTAATATTIWGPFTGAAPLTGTITLVIHLPGGAVEATQTSTLTPATNCVARNSPTITTSLSAASITVPGSVHDSSTLSGATATAGGTVSYAVYTDGACSVGVRSAGSKTVVNGKVPDSDDLTFTTAGTYSWQATYSGDAANNSAKSACGTETLTATAPVVTQAIAGHIYDCTGGTQTTAEVLHGTIDATGPTNVAATANPMSAPVLAGDYVEHGTAPAGYHFVTCAGAATVVTPTTATTDVTVPSGGNGAGIFYVALTPLTGTLGANIYDCTGGIVGTVDVPGGTVAASGPTMISTQPNPLGSTTVTAGDYIVTAGAPGGYHFIACRDQVASGTRTVTVPAGGSAQATYYVTHDTGNLGGHIYDCTNGATTTEVGGGALGASGPTPVGTRPNPIAPTMVLPGDYVVTGTAPAGYTLANCANHGTGPQTVTVPANGGVEAIFYVTRTPVVPVTAAGTEAANGSQGARPAQASQAAQAGNVAGAAGATQPVTGHADMLRAGFVSLLLILGGAALAAASRGSRPAVSRL